jgi:iron only hydrogenase large subunit-like protein
MSAGALQHSITSLSRPCDLHSNALPQEAKAAEAAGKLTPAEDGHAVSSILPMFTSCCPGWVSMVEKSNPELIPYLSR